LAIALLLAKNLPVSPHDHNRRVIGGAIHHAEIRLTLERFRPPLMTIGFVAGASKGHWLPLFAVLIKTQSRQSFHLVDPTTALTLSPFVRDLLTTDIKKRARFLPSSSDRRPAASDLRNFEEASTFSPEETLGYSSL
jgi:hypothetical protein